MNVAPLCFRDTRRTHMVSLAFTHTIVFMYLFISAVSPSSPLVPLALCLEDLCLPCPILFPSLLSRSILFSITHFVQALLSLHFLTSYFFFLPSSHFICSPRRVCLHYWDQAPGTQYLPPCHAARKPPPWLLLC